MNMLLLPQKQTSQKIPKDDLRNHLETLASEALLPGLGPDKAARACSFVADKMGTWRMIPRLGYVVPLLQTNPPVLMVFTRKEGDFHGLC